MRLPCALLLLLAAPAAAGPEPARPRPVPEPAALPRLLAPDAASLSDGAFCGIEPAGDAAQAPSCKLPGLPCGPVPAARIGRGASEPQDDLDGDGRPDITLA